MVKKAKVAKRVVMTKAETMRAEMKKRKKRRKKRKRRSLRISSRSLRRVSTSPMVYGIKARRRSMHFESGWRACSVVDDEYSCARGAEEELKR